MPTILFVDKNSIYKTIAGLDCYDVDRDAMTYTGNDVIIAHPPCRLWGRLAQFSTAPESEKDLARYAVKLIRKNGGILEHPAYSKLWIDQGLPKPGDSSNPIDFTLDIDQFWFGHKAQKRTWLYIHGITINDLPTYSINLNMVTYVISTNKNKRGDNLYQKYIPKSQRAATPLPMAEWLIETARRIETRRASK